MTSLFDPWLVSYRDGRRRFRPMTDSDKRAMLAAVADRQTFDDCCIWPGRKNPDGYGRVTLDGHEVGAHRAVFEAMFGELASDLVLDHWLNNWEQGLCPRSCVNIHHLRAITNRENVLVGHGITAVLARRTHCAKGHVLPPADRHGRRRCRECVRGHYWYRVAASFGFKEPQPCLHDYSTHCALLRMPA